MPETDIERSLGLEGGVILDPEAMISFIDDAGFTTAAKTAGTSTAPGAIPRTTGFRVVCLSIHDQKRLHRLAAAGGDLR
jgi:hypothetical protein